MTCCFQCATVRAAQDRPVVGPGDYRFLPLAAIRVFFQILQLWELSGCLPLQLKQARQIPFCKPGKITLGLSRSCHACGEFMYASSWTRNAQLCAWVKAHLHASVAYGKGMRHTIV